MFVFKCSANIINSDLHYLNGINQFVGIGELLFPNCWQIYLLNYLYAPKMLLMSEVCMQAIESFMYIEKYQKLVYKISKKSKNIKLYNGFLQNLKKMTPVLDDESLFIITQLNKTIVIQFNQRKISIPIGLLFLLFNGAEEDDFFKIFFIIYLQKFFPDFLDILKNNLIYVVILSICYIINGNEPKIAYFYWNNQPVVLGYQIKQINIKQFYYVFFCSAALLRHRSFQNMPSFRKQCLLYWVLDAGCDS